MLSQGFNSRTLGRVRHPPGAIVSSVGVFQFTHPGKGATTYVSILISWDYVSIHAPWEGCDFSLMQFYLDDEGFQFTHPGKGATPRSNAA